MRGKWAGAILAAMAPTQALACNTDILTVEKWEIEVVDDRTNRLSTTIRSHAEKPIRMIDAQANFRDALDGHIAGFNLNRDTSVAPGAEFTTTGLWGPYTFERLLTLRPDEVSTSVCVRAVLYEDGSKENFQ